MEPNGGEGEIVGVWCSSEQRNGGRPSRRDFPALSSGEAVVIENARNPSGGECSDRLITAAAAPQTTRRWQWASGEVVVWWCWVDRNREEGERSGVGV